MSNYKNNLKKTFYGVQIVLCVRHLICPSRYTQKAGTIITAILQLRKQDQSNLLKIRKLIRGINGSQTKSVRLYSPCSLLLCYAVSYCIPLIIPPSMTLLCFTNTACHLLKACVTAQTCIPAITKDSHPHRQQTGAGTLGATVTTSRSASNRLPGPVVVIDPHKNPSRQVLLSPCQRRRNSTESSLKPVNKDRKGGNAEGLWGALYS